jgi:hypothetical protein
MTVDNRTSLSTERKYRLSSDTLFEVVTVDVAENVRGMFYLRGFTLPESANEKEVV